MKKIYPSLVPILMVSVCISCFSLAGCSKDKMDEMVAKAKDSATEFKDKSGDALKKAKAGASDAASKIKETTSDTVASAKEQAAKLRSGAGNIMSMNGTAKITLDKPTDFPASYLRVIPLAADKSVVQLKSYAEDGESYSFPAYFIQGTIKPGSLDGQSVSCRLFAQKKKDGPVWENPPGQPVVVTFKKSEDKMTASFSNTTLINMASSTQANSSGTFECVPLN